MEIVQLRTWQVQGFVELRKPYAMSSLFSGVANSRHPQA